MRSTSFTLFVALVSLAGLFVASAASQSAVIAPLANSPDSIHIKHVSGSSQVSCSVPAYSHFQQHSEISLYDIALKFVKKVEVVWRYHQDPQLTAAQMALKRSNPIATTNILISFKLPHNSRSQATTFPGVLRDAVERLITPYIGATAAKEWATDVDKCAWVNSRSFFDNTVGILCALDELKFSMDATSVEWKRTWQAVEEGQEAPKRVIERLTLSKASDSSTIWNYDPATYVYDPSDTKHSTTWNVTREFDSWLPVGRYEVSPSSAKSAAASTLQVSSITIPLALKLLPSTIQRNLTKSGMHRDLITSTTHKRISPPTGRISCRLASIELLQDTIFVDQYEVEEIARFGGPSTMIYRAIDLEKPSFLSSQNIIITSTPVPWDSSSSNLSLPLHFRYQMPNPSESYSGITINPSIIVTMCAQSSRPPPSPDTNTVISLLMGYLPTLPQGHTIYFHHDSSSPSSSSSSASATPGAIQIPWPVGRWSDLSTVSPVTFIVTLAMSLTTIAAVLYKASR